MDVINYPHPTLRYKSSALKRVDKRLKKLVAEMFELMYEHKGIGLAANQVNLPFQLFLVNPTGEPGSEEERVLINPVIQKPRGNSEAEEGCLSIPGVHGQVVRPAEVQVIAYDLSGNEMNETVDGLLARVIQHEFDHLQGVMFPDRMTEAAVKMIADELEEFEIEYQAMLRKDEGYLAENVHKELKKLEAEYC